MIEFEQEIFEQEIKDRAKLVQQTIEPYGDGIVKTSNGRVARFEGVLHVDSLDIRVIAFPGFGPQHKYHYVGENPQWAMMALNPLNELDLKGNEVFRQRVREPVLHDIISLAVNSYCIEAAKQTTIEFRELELKKQQRINRLINGIIRRFDLSFTQEKLIKDIPNIETVSRDKVFLVFEILTQFPQEEKRSVTLEVIKTLVDTSEMDLLVAYSKIDPAKSQVDGFIEEINTVRIGSLTEDQKLAIISRIDLKRAKKLYPKNR